MKILHLNIIVLIIASGITSVVFARLRCPRVTLLNGSAKTQTRGRTIRYKCYRGYMLLGDPFSACFGGKWEPDPPVCLKPGCTPVRSLKNGLITASKRSALLEFSCNPGYKLVGPSFIYCNGITWSAMQPYCRAADITCNFESETTCSWSVETHDEDDFMWHVQQHESPSRLLGTGPKTDHTFSTERGHYLMIETSDYGSGSELLPARIHSPKFPVPSRNDTCFIFWYHMFGATVGMLNVFLNNKVVFQDKDNHGDRWIKGIVPLPQNETELQIIIEGTYGGEHTGDVGLDDFSIGNGTDCIYSKVTSCEGMCNKNLPETATCLCSFECFVDSSCCEDYDEFCNTGTTAATSLETESYETEISESITSEESSTAATEIASLASTNIIDSSEISISPFEEDISKADSTRNFETSDMSSSLSQVDELITSKSQTVPGQYSKGNSTKELFSTVNTEQRQTNEQFNRLTTTPFITVHTIKDLTPAVTVNETQKVSSTTINLFSKEKVPSLEIDTTKKLTVPTIPTAPTTESTLPEKTKKPNSIKSTSQTLAVTATRPTLLRNYTLSTLPSKSFLTSKYNITRPTSDPIYRSKTIVPKSILTKRTQPFFYSSTTTKRSKVTKKSAFPTTKNNFRTKPTLTTYKKKFEPTTKYKLLKMTTLSLSVNNSIKYRTTQVPTIKHNFTEVNIVAKTSTINPTIKLTAFNTRSQKPTIQSKRKTMTLAQTTERMKIIATIPDKTEPKQPVNSSVDSQPTGTINSKVGVNLNPILTSKEKLQSTPEEINDYTSLIMDIIVTGVSIIIVLAGGILIGVFIVKRRRLRFVNDSEGDVLYASSEEMLDLHLAREFL